MQWLRDQVVLITGGTAGLGLAMAQSWGQAGARIAICGRDPQRLQQALDQLRQAGVEAAGFAADVTSPDSTASLWKELEQRFSRLDILINNVGRSTRGFAAETSPEQFQELLEANFLSAVRCTQQALPLLRASRGHLVFLGSLASKTAAPYLGAYPPSKFAVAAYAQQLRLELGPEGVHVLLVCPGPIARPDATRRYEESGTALPESARKPGGGVHLRGIPPEQLARQIATACQRRDPELVVPWKARLLFALAQLSPTLGDWIVRRQTR